MSIVSPQENKENSVSLKGSSVMQGFRAASSALAPIDINSPARVAPPSDSKYKSMVGELQEMVEELEAENHGLNEALANEQQNVEQYKGELKQLQAQMVTQEEQLEAAAQERSILRAEQKQGRLAALVYKACANELAAQLRAAEAAAKEAAAKEQVNKVRFEEEAKDEEEVVPQAAPVVAPASLPAPSGAEARIATLEAELYAARRCIVLQTELRHRAEKAAEEAVVVAPVPSSNQGTAQLLGLPEAATEEYHARWCEAAAENVDLRVESAQLKQQLDEALSVVETVAEIDTLQAEFDAICDAIPEMQKEVCKAMEEKIVAQQAAEEARLTVAAKETEFSSLKESMERAAAELQAAFAEGNAKNTALAQHIDGLEASLAEATRSLEAESAQRAECEALRVGLEARVARFEAELATAVGKAAEAEEDRAMAAASLKTKETFFQGITAEMKSLQAKLSKQDEELAASRGALEAAQKKHAEEKAALEFDVSASQDALEQANAKHASVVSMGMETMSQMEATFQEDRGCLEAQRQQAQHELEAKTEELAAVTAQLDAGRLEIEARDATVANLETRLAHVTGEMEEARADIVQQGEDAAEMLDTLREQYEGLVMKREEELSQASREADATASRLMEATEAHRGAVEHAAQLSREMEHQAAQAQEKARGLDAKLADTKRELREAREAHTKSEEAALARYEKEFKTSHAKQSALEEQILSTKAKAEKREKILEQNLKNAENEVDELDEMVTNAYGILKKHPRVLQENTSLQLLLKALERD